MRSGARHIQLIMLLTAFLTLLGCGRDSNKFVPPPPPDVTISQPVKQKVTNYLEATGTVAALESVKIRARIEGWLETINFEPRAWVKKDSLLFRIDQRPFQAKVDQARAVVEGKKADLKLAQIEWQKADYLLSKAAISELKMDEATAKRDMARAQVGIAQANLETAKLNLSYTKVTAPIEGRVSRNLVDIGNLVGAENKTLLTTMVNDKSVYAYFNLSELSFLPLMRKYLKKIDGSPSTGDQKRDPTPAFLGLADEQGYPHKGHIDYADTQVDPHTGTIQLRAIIPNSNGLILQGMFVRIRIPVSTQESLLVPDVAVQADQSGKYVLVVNKKNMVEKRQVNVAQRVDRMRVITKGLTDKDRVIVNGLQRARPGGEVKPTRAAAGSSPSAKTNRTAQ
jgi:multidrug efflux system membrane fusion protein